MLQRKLKVDWIGLGWYLGGSKYRAAHLLNPLAWGFVPLLEEAVSGKPAEVMVVEVEVDAAKSVSIGTMRRKIRSPILNFVNGHDDDGRENEQNGHED